MPWAAMAAVGAVVGRATGGATARPATRRTNCSNCGGPLRAFTHRCDYCGGPNDYRADTHGTSAPAPWVDVLTAFKASGVSMAPAMDPAPSSFNTPTDYTPAPSFDAGGGGDYGGGGASGEY